MRTMIKILRLPILLGLSLTISACSATTGNSAQSIFGAEPEEERSAYGAFLAARVAGSSRDTRNASDYYARAMERAPQSGFLSERAFIASLMAGDTGRAIATARDAANAADETRLARLYLATDAIADRRYSQAREWLDAEGFGPFNSFLAEVLDDWARAGMGDVDGAIARAEAATPPGFATAFHTLHRALLLEQAGRDEEAGTIYSLALSQTPFRRMAVELLGANLERRGERAEAAGLYRGYLMSEANEPTIRTALERVEAQRRAPREPNLRQRAGLAMYGPAALFATQAEMDLSVIYLRFAQRLEPEYATTRLLLASTLERLEMYEAAIAEYSAVPEGPFHQSAQIDRIYLLARTGEEDAAFAEARQLATESDSIDARTLLADLHRWRGDLDEAQAGYGAVIAERLALGQVPTWQLYYFQAGALETLDRWDEAEPLFLQALEIAPDEPQILNYLGYAWVVRGENIERAFTMIGRAAAAEPTSGYIIDSLGWAHYVRGNFDEAVQHLERAAALSPDSPTINYHLGDAYWQVGRYLEARFQWERALELEPEPEEIEGLQARLESGRVPAEGETAVVESQVSQEP